MARRNLAKRVLRGGSWNNNARNVRSAYRNRNDPEDRNDNVGFRCARAHGPMDVAVLNRAGFPPLATGGRNQRAAGVLVGRGCAAKARRRAACA
ncbi:formylglycine-generating enzyme family protein [Rhodoblastus sphagnicola]|uniref:formylglycine-generating enzyme family protein n=1 Tax=Rhodoblastus sphagnicola TaxID=333368 RepID=UPI003CC849AE